MPAPLHYRSPFSGPPYRLVRQPGSRNWWPENYVDSQIYRRADELRPRELTKPVIVLPFGSEMTSVFCTTERGTLFPQFSFLF